jgi:hypothetical protein
LGGHGGGGVELGVALGEGEAAGLVDALGLRLDATLGEGVGDAEGVGLAVGEAVWVGVGLGFRLGVGGIASILMSNAEIARL